MEFFVCHSLFECLLIATPGQNLSRLCQFKIWLVPKRYKKTAGTDVTWCVTGIQVPWYLGYLGTSRYPEVTSRYSWVDSPVTQLVILGKVLISCAFLIYGFMYIMWFVTACSFIWYLVWKFALQLSFGWWKIEELKIIKRNCLFCFVDGYLKFLGCGSEHNK